MALPSVQTAAEKYAARASGAAQEWQQGAQRTDKDPTALAAAAASKAQANYNAAITSGRWQRSLSEAGKSGWLAGINRPEASSAYSGGVSGKGKDKWATAMNRWFPVFQSLQSQIDTMPNVTEADSIARVAAWIRGTKQAKANM